MTNPVTISFSLAAPIANGISLNQTLGSAANLSLNGTLVSASVANLTTARRVAVTSAGSDAGINWILTGTDRWGNVQTETFAGGTSAATYSVYDYVTVTALRSSGATAAGVVAGTNGNGSTAWYPREFMAPGTLGVAIYMATQDAVTGSFETTMDDPNAAQSLSLRPYATSVNPLSNVPPVPWPEQGLANINASTRVEIHNPCFAWRWTNYTGTSSTVVQVIETVPWMKDVF